MASAGGVCLVGLYAATSPQRDKVGQGTKNAETSTSPSSSNLSSLGPTTGKDKNARPLGALITYSECMMKMLGLGDL